VEQTGASSQFYDKFSESISSMVCAKLNNFIIIDARSVSTNLITLE
jgi:hypothetical protein